MFYEEQVRDGVLCYRSMPAGEWVPMTAERLTAMLLELRQRQVVSTPSVVPPHPHPAVPQPTWAPIATWQPPFTVTCGGAQ